MEEKMVLQEELKYIVEDVSLTEASVQLATSVRDKNFCD